MASWDLPDIYKNPSPFDEEATRRLIERSEYMGETLQKKLNEINNQRIGVRDPWGGRGLHPVIVVSLVLLLFAGVIRLCVHCCRCCKRRSQELPAPTPARAPVTAPVSTPASVPAGYVVVQQHPPSYNELPRPPAPANDSVRLLPGPGDSKPAPC